MSQKLRLENAEAIRDSVTVEMGNDILNVYKKAHKECKQTLKKYKNLPMTTSNQLRIKQYAEMEKRLRTIVHDTDKELNGIIKKGMYKTVQAVFKDVTKILNKIGFKGNTFFSGVDTKVITALTSGKVYDTGFSLSSAIWGNNEKILKDMHSIIAQAVAQNKSSYEIAKDIEKYVDPTAKKDWQWSKVYPNTNKVVDYNAQRLARTLVSHAYQQSFLEGVKDNPYVKKVQWRSALIHGRTCQICRDRHGQQYNKDNVPLDHPNGLCTLIIVQEKSLLDISNDLKSWDGTKEDNEQLYNWNKKLHNI